MAFTNKKIIAGNWKMNGSKDFAWGLVQGIMDKIDNCGGRCGNAELILCPPFHLLSILSEMANGYPIALGAQNCNDHTEGAFTGEISPAMLKDIGCKFVIVGHSERRAYYNETSEFIAQKAELALATGITPIICIGETLEEKEAGKADEIITNQFNASIPANATADNIVIAYEPVWAIGTGKSATTMDIVAINETIRKASLAKFGTADITILYGGSVKPSNASEIFAIESVGGALIGGAALKSDDFWGIAEKA